MSKVLDQDLYNHFQRYVAVLRKWSAYYLFYIF